VVGPGVFDAQGKRSIESPHFPPQGLVLGAQGEGVSEEGGSTKRVCGSGDQETE